MLADVDALRLHLDLDGSKDALLTQILAGVDAAIASYTDRRLAQATYTEYYSGTGQAEIPLREYPIDPISVSVWVDSLGAFGQYATGFGTTTALTRGTDFSLLIDGADGTGGTAGGASGILVRGGAGAGLYFDRRFTVAGGWMPSVWMTGVGNIKVTYTAGYAPIPADLTLAALQFAATVYRTRFFGGIRAQSERLGEYSYSLMAGAADDAMGTMGSVRQLLAPYARRSVM